MSNRNVKGQMPAPETKMPSPADLLSSGSFEDPKPEMVTAAITDATVKVKADPVGIEVVALRSGYYRCSRKEAGDRFKVGTMDKLGSWMKCVDPEVEAQHQARLKARKNASRVAGE